MVVYLDLTFKTEFDDDFTLTIPYADGTLDAETVKSSMEQIIGIRGLTDNKGVLLKSPVKAVFRKVTSRELDIN